jgi:hypothetical protein
MVSILIYILAFTPKKNKEEKEANGGKMNKFIIPEIQTPMSYQEPTGLALRKIQCLDL